MGKLEVTPTAASIPFDNSGNGMSSKDLQRAVEEVRGAISASYFSSTGTVTTSSSSYGNIPGISNTPEAGTYIAIFNGRAYTTGASAGGLFGIAVGGSIVADSVREVSCNIVLLGIITISLNTIAAPVVCQTKITVDGTQSVTPQFKSTTGATIGVMEKDMILIKVAS